MNKDKEIVDIEEFSQEVDQLHDLIKPIQSNFQAIVFDYMNKISTKLGSNPITSTRTDLLFRIQAIIYFVKLMHQEESTLLKFLNNNPRIDDMNRMRLSDELIQNQKSIFDTILYHLSSIYDYYANMAGQIYNGKGLKWNGLFYSANNPQNDKIGEPHKNLIIRSHKDFVDSLFSHRSYLIHTSMSHPGFEYISKLGTGEYIINAFAPEKFIKEFKILKKKVGNNQITLKESMIWTLKHGLRNINELLYGMKDELERLRKIKKENDVIIDSRFTDKDVSTPYWRKE